MRWRTILFNIGFSCSCLLAFLLIFEHKLQVPVWLQVFGRIHPLFLHLPIGMLLLYAGAEILTAVRSRWSISGELKDLILLLSFTCVAITSLMGLLLSREEGYDNDGVAAHKWWGAGLCFLLLLWYLLRARIRTNRVWNVLVSVIGIIVITVTGHLGGTVTHGEDFVLAPLISKKEKIAVKFDDAIVFRDMVQPILEEKCVSCHNEKKAKGELIMETRELLLKGGKNGKLWDTAAKDMGQLLHRVHLPLEDEDHMPPEGKPQLTENEVAILEAWIRGGSDFTRKVVELPKGDTLRQLAGVLFQPADEDNFSFPKADEKLIGSLNTFYRVVQPIAKNSPALTVRFFNASQFSDSALSQLDRVKEQVVEVDLSRMPVTDKQVERLATFPNLRNLNLSFTPINGEGLSRLSSLKHLREISLSGTGVSANRLAELKKFPSLRKVFVWNTGASEEELSKLGKETKNIIFQTGYQGDSMVLKLTAPILANEKSVLDRPVELKLKHNINGAVIRYTLDGSEPDSLNSPIYKPGIMIDRDLVLKTKAFRPGWESSVTRQAVFILGGIKPDSIFLDGPPDPNFPGGGPESLIDDLLGDSSLRGTEWIGYLAPDRFGAWLTFNQETTAGAILLSSYIFKPTRIFAPALLEVSVGMDRQHMMKVGSLKSALPPKDFKHRRMQFEFPLPDKPFKFIRIDTKPFLQPLPTWFDGPAKKARMLFDEIVIKTKDKS